MTSFTEKAASTPIVPFLSVNENGRQLAVRSYWGQTFTPGNYFDAQWYFDIPWRDLTYRRPPVLPGIAIDDTIPESMLLACRGGFDNWLRWVFTNGSDDPHPRIGRPGYRHPIYAYLVDQLGLHSYGSLKYLTYENYDPNFNNPDITSQAREKIIKDVNVYNAQVSQEWSRMNAQNLIDVNTLFNFLDSHANVYGRYWTASVPLVCYRDLQQAGDLFGTEPEDPTSNDTPIYEWSDMPSVDGAWIDTIASSSDSSDYCDGVSSVVGMQHRADTDMFTSDNGLMGALLRFDALYDDFQLGLINSSEYFYKQVSLDLGIPSLYVRASLAPQWIFVPDQTRGSEATRVSALLSIDGYVMKKDRTDINPISIQNQFMGGILGWNSRSALDINPGQDVLSSSSFVQNSNRNLFRDGYMLGAMYPSAMPRQALIPILSKTRNYGPWNFNAKFANTNLNVTGKTKVIQDDSLVPWEYGGCKYLSLGAIYLSQSIISDVDRGERGSVSIAGYPENQLGAEITKQPINLSDRVIESRDYGGFEYNYVNVGGPSKQTSQITNLSVSVGPGGITTQYQLSSFTPVFQAFNKLDQDRFKRLGQQVFQNAKNIRQSTMSNFSSLRAVIREFMNRTGANNWTAHDDFGGDFRTPSSPHTFYVGAYDKPDNDSSDTDFTQKNIGSVPLRELMNYNSFEVGSTISADGFFRPVKTKKGNANHPDNNSIPQDNQVGTPPTNQPKQSVDPYGPLNAGTQYVGPVINKDYLDFLANPTDSLVTQRDPHATDWSNQEGQSANPLEYPSGHDIEVVGRSNFEDLGRENNFYLGIRDEANNIGYTDDYRYMAHRGPIVVHGWGYDIMGKPVPNKEENNATAGGSESAGNLLNGGKFGSHQKTYEGLSDQFYGGWLQRPDTWPAGPIDLRWDRNRGVWTVPSDLRFYLVRLDNDLNSVGDTATCNVRNAEDVFDADGSAITSPKVLVTMPYADATIEGGQDILVYWSHESGMYFPIQACCGGGGGPVDPPDPPTPPCEQCDSRCEYECTAGGWVIVNDNCQSQPGCSCPGALACLPIDLCQPATHGLRQSCICANTDCPQYFTHAAAVSPTTETGIDFFSDRQIAGIQGMAVVELIADMPYTTGYASASGLTKVFDDQAYASIVSGTGVDYSAIICTPGQTGQDPFCPWSSTNPYTVIVSNVNNKYNLPSGTVIAARHRYGVNLWEVMEYELPNKGCLEVSADTALNYYNKVMVDASAGEVVLALPLSTGLGMAGSEYEVKKIDASVNNVIVSGTGTDTVDGQTTYTISNQYEAAKFVACGTDQWFVF